MSTPQPDQYPPPPAQSGPPGQPGPYAQPGQPGPYPDYRPAPPTNGFAIAALVLSLVGVSILGVIFGHISLKQIRERGEGGRGLALAGLIVGYVGLAILVIAIIAMFAVLGAVSSELENF